MNLLHFKCQSNRVDVINMQIERIILRIDYDRHRSLHFGRAALSTHTFFFNFTKISVVSIDPN